MKKILVTGMAGFIGFHLCRKLVKSGFEVTGLDSINDYYDPELKYNRLHFLGFHTEEIEYGKLLFSARFLNLSFIKLKLEDKEGISKLFAEQKFDYVVNLAAQAGVRYSLENPHAYIDANINGFVNILEACRYNHIKHLMYASTSSVYGLNKTMPLSEHSAADHPITLYAATKKANEMLAHSYSHLFQLPTTGLRFFTVYGPWGRPDMALFLFAKAILNNEPVKLFNNGNMVRDFTYVEDIAESICRLAEKMPAATTDWDAFNPDPSISSAPYRILNIGNSQPTPLVKYLEALEKALGKKAIIHYLPMQPGDVPATHADCSELEKVTGFKPMVNVEEGIQEFVNWYVSYFEKKELANV